MCSPTFVGTNMIFISLALPCLKRFINTSVKYVYVWHPRLWYHSQRPRPALADGAAFETVNRAACFKRFKQCFKSFCLKLFLCVSILVHYHFCYMSILCWEQLLEGQIRP